MFSSTAHGTFLALLTACVHSLSALDAATAAQVAATMLEWHSVAADTVPSYSRHCTHGGICSFPAILPPCLPFQLLLL